MLKRGRGWQRLGNEDREDGCDQDILYTCRKSSKEFFSIFRVEGEGVCDFSEKMAQQLNIWYKCM